jgi:hypothetical protein
MRTGGSAGPAQGAYRAKQVVRQTTVIERALSLIRADS